MVHDIPARLAAALHEAGLDVFGCVRVGAYNKALRPDQSGWRLPVLGSDDDMAVLIGNTRRIWPCFMDAWRHTTLRDEPDPLDTYVRRHVDAASHALASELGLICATRHAFDPPPRAVAMQRLAVIAGVAELAPIGLCVHERYGSWFALRAVAVFNVPGPQTQAPAPTCSACAERPCLGPGKDLLDAFHAQDDGRLAQFTWQDWLAMRDACPVGREERFSEQQVRYHYIRDLRLLDEK